ncbi:hypothetical protein [Arthrobacter sp. efr-133-R2A-120]|uniref:hypothetical protein n=1 Tax=Arthrobacter sp. efr-133-R2A-120 TaxID=3040277 RepID=UPI0025500545|nr:hypothetical protein [Arthrobacter sp. efr-133-R2A-120]
MHVASDVKEHLFDVTIDGSPRRPGEVMAGWSPHDRFGIVVREPFGALGASLLIQLAALQFYEARTARRDENPQYPQTYLFHVGGAFGDHSSFDVWPARHEVMVTDAPCALLGEINDRGITRLAVPIGRARPLDYLQAQASGWTDRSAALDRISSVLVYSPDGHVPDHDVTVRAADRQLELMTSWSLDAEGTKRHFDGLTDQELVEMEIGPSTATDLRSWTAAFGKRINEIPRSQRKALALRRRQEMPGLVRTETFRRVTVDEGLALL